MLKPRHCGANKKSPHWGIVEYSTSKLPCQDLDYKICQVSKNHKTALKGCFMIERVGRIELPLTGWKPVVIAFIRYPHFQISDV